MAIKKDSFYNQFEIERRKDYAKSIINEIGIDDTLFKDVINTFYSYWGYCNKIRREDVSKNYKLIKYILTSYGFSEEEAIEFIKRNARMLCTDYNSLASKISVIFALGYFDYVFFQNPSVLTLYRTSTNVKDLYAYLSDNREVNSTLSSDIEALTEGEKLYLRQKYPFTTELRNEYYAEFVEFLKNKRKNVRAIIKSDV